MDANISQEEKILLATIQCIEENGIPGTTIRRIAELAKVNSAAISYYFRSKDVLLEKAMMVALKNAFDFDNFPDPSSLDTKEWLTIVFLTMVEGGKRYPGLTRAFFHDMIIEGSQDTLTEKSLNRFLEALLDQMKKANLGLNEKELRTIILQIASAAFLVPVLFSHALKGFHPGFPDSPEEWKDYISRIVNKLL